VRYEALHGYKNLERAALIVDSHCHVGRSWYEPVEALMFQLDRNGVERAVLVQSLAQYDNCYQADCVARFPDRLASVVRVDEALPDAAERLVQEVARGAAGVRLRPDTRSPGGDPLLLWRLAAELGITVSCVGGAAEFAAPEFAEILTAFPSLPVVLEHAGNLRPLTAGYDTCVDQRIMELGSLPNAYVKFHGIGEYGRKLSSTGDGFPFQRPVPDLVNRAIRAFGVEKSMWGSDYPVVSGREGYRNALVWAREELGMTEAELDQVFGGVALRLHWRGERQ
jgi:L-fuconolactonase